jgi:hypothetical protein
MTPVIIQVADGTWLNTQTGQTYSQMPSSAAATQTGSTTSGYQPGVLPSPPPVNTQPVNQTYAVGQSTSNAQPQQVGYSVGTSAGGTSAGQSSSGYAAPNTQAGAGMATDIVSSVFGDVDRVINNVLGVANSVNAYNASKDTNAINQGYLTLAQKNAALAAQGQQFGQNMSMENLLNAREATRLNQATTQEGLMTSGMNRFQSGVAFGQSQQDRAKQQKFLAALSQGVARGLSERTNLTTITRGVA